jgi:hypothetical protein
MRNSLAHCCCQEEYKKSTQSTSTTTTLELKGSFVGFGDHVVTEIIVLRG